MSLEIPVASPCPLWWSRDSELRDVSVIRISHDDASEQWANRGRTIHTPDALIAGTARSHGAVLLTPDLETFPMRDLRVEHPGAADE